MLEELVKVPVYGGQLLQLLELLHDYLEDFQLLVVLVHFLQGTCHVFKLQSDGGSEQLGVLVAHLVCKGRLTVLLLGF